MDTDASYRNWTDKLSSYVPKLARKYGIDKQARTFSPWSHVVALLYAQLTHSFGLNDVCDALRIHGRKLGAIRGATPPARNTLSHANKTRDSDFMEELFWKTLRHLEGQLPGFGLQYKGVPRRFKCAIHAVDSSTIALIANCMSWAKHRRRKAAAKLHLRLDLQSFLPGFAAIIIQLDRQIIQSLISPLPRATSSCHLTASTKLTTLLR